MKALTIYGLDESLEQAINDRAAQQQQSVSQWIVETLRKALSENDKEGENHLYYDLDHLAGGWDKEETKSFLKNIQVFETIDDEVWK